MTQTDYSYETAQNSNQEKNNSAPQFEALIVGAGFGGMGAAIELKKMGIQNLKIIERASGIGGTWYNNTYPGIAVDIPSATYSYSFEPNPFWSRLYAPGKELKNYANHVAEKYDLKRHMQFNSPVAESHYDEEAKTWHVTTEAGEKFTTRILILATGFLSQPKRPDIPGLESFSGKIIHTAEWDHDYDMEGKKVAVIGTGATSVQLIPELAKKVSQLNVYQRTPIWVTPKFDFEVPKSIQNIFAKFPLSQKIVRTFSSSILEMVMVIGALYNRQFSGLTRRAEDVATRFLKKQVKDEKLREQLLPDYSFGCKRPTFSNEYFRTFSNPNVELVTEDIHRIDAKGIVSGDDKLREIDTLVLATGFKMWEKGNFPAFDVVGRNNVELGKHWFENGYESYDGLSIHGFPNFFNLASPYAFTGLSYFFTIEGQMKHINRCVGAMRKSNAESFEITESAQSRFVNSMKHRLRNSVFVNGQCSTANSYYFNGRGEANLLRPTSTISALRHAGNFPLANYSFK